MAMIGRRFGNNRKVIKALFVKSMEGAGLGYRNLDSVPGKIFLAGFGDGFQERTETHDMKRFKDE